MHIPPYYKRKSWQRFLSGMLLGALVGYGIFLFIHGSLMEHWVEENIRLKGELSDLEATYENLLENHESEKKQYTVEQTEIELTNNDIDRLTKHQLQTLIKEEIQDVIGKNVEELSKNSEFLYKTIENKQFTIDDFTYKVEVKQLTIARVLSIKVKVSVNT
ncbi:sporulation membrane protein YtrI [Thalassobacillus pellis]|uniref:sporulation membrane protein YtrI n=1 Tax=Thalassobacillus pellis TaxID=748008 RepID=UPI00195F4D40|nr:sporulation membrane protein YtrI [Thalassobacillus pellis]MBM7554976.1 gas vesicle protein [Thalassobacillus pellis]